MKTVTTDLGEAHIHGGEDEVARAGADAFVALIAGVLADRALARVALAGGSTPRAMYRLLASPGYRDRVDWSRVEVFFGDERCVAPDHPDSNYRMAKEALLDHVPLAAHHVHRILGELHPSEAAAQYGERLAGLRHGDAEWPRLDLVLLGMGEDGHTASLFPGTPVLDERRALTAAVFVDKLDSWRVTMTVPVLSAAAHVRVLTVGEKKADALALALAGPPGKVPISLVRAVDEAWLIDEAAAQKWRAGR